MKYLGVFKGRICLTVMLSMVSVATALTVSPADTIDPAGADSLTYNSPALFYSIEAAGSAVGAARITSTDMKNLEPNKFGVLDFETANGWNQTAHAIQTVGSGAGSSLASNWQTTPYASDDQIGSTPITIAGMTGSDGQPLTVTFTNVERNTGAESGIGIFREYDEGTVLSQGYLVTSGNHGLVTPWRNITDSSVHRGIMITFSAPVQAAGVVQNYGGSYGRSPLVRWYAEDGSLLSTLANTGVNPGEAIFFGLQTNTPAIKSMWVGDSTSYPPIQTIDDVAFVVDRSFTVTPASKIDPDGADSITWNSEPGFYTIFEDGVHANAEEVNSVVMELLNPGKFGVLDFETANGWNQTAYPIQTSGSGAGSSLASNWQTTPYASGDQIGSSPITIAGMTGSDGQPLTVTFTNVERDTGAVGGLGVFREYDDGTVLSQYLVTSGNHGLVTPWREPTNEYMHWGIMVTFSSPVLAAGVVQNYGGSYGRSPTVRWYGEDINELAEVLSGTNVGDAAFWGLKTIPAAIKYMWIGDSSVYPPIQTIDDIAILSGPAPVICGDAGTVMPGDFNSDCYIDFNDYAIFASRWMISCPDPLNPECEQAEPTSMADLHLIAQDWLKCTDPVNTNCLP